MLATEGLMRIQDVIDGFFPEALLEPITFEDWVSPLRADANPGAADLLSKLEEWLKQSKSALSDQETLTRDYWEIFGGNDKLLKSFSSIRSKLARDLLNEINDGCRPGGRLTEEQLKSRIYQFGDLGRVRVVTDFFSDIDFLQKKLFESDRFLGNYPCPKGIKDFTFDPKFRDGLKGHRARQFSVLVPITGELDFGFEIQLMTRLQHAWDRRNHPLYEWQRENNEWREDQEAIEIAVDDFACAEALHLVDRQADRNWARFLNKSKHEKEVIHE